MALSFKSTSGLKVTLHVLRQSSQFSNKSNLICSTVFDLHGTLTTDNDDNKNTRQNETLFQNNTENNTKKRIQNIFLKVHIHAKEFYIICTYGASASA